MTKPKWVVYSSLALSLVGLAVSTYLTIAHFNEHVVLACPENSTINCQKVTTSAESHFLGIPVAILGLLFYIFMVTVNLPMMWRRSSLEIPRLLASLLGVGFILWLVYSELVLIKAICLWCTSIHITTLALFLVLLYAQVTYRDLD